MPAAVKPGWKLPPPPVAGHCPPTISIMGTVSSGG